MNVSGFLTKTIGRKIGLGFGAVIFVMVLIVGVTLVQVQRTSQLADRIIELRNPTVVASTTMLNGINQSLAGLRGYMLLGTDTFKEERRAAWEESLYPAFETMKGLSEAWTSTENRERLAEIEELLSQFEQYQQEIEEIAPSDPETAREWLGTRAAPTAREIKDHLRVMVEHQRQLAEDDSAQAQEAQSWLKIMMGLLLLLGSVVASGIAIYSTRSIVRPVRELSESAERISDGDLTATVAIKTNDEIGALGGSFNQMVESVKQSEEALRAEKASVEQKVEEAVRESEAQKQYLQDSVDEILVQMERFADGDLTVTLDVRNDDEIGRLYTGFNQAVRNMERVIRRLMGLVDTTASASAQISASSEQLATASQEQSSQADEVAAAVEEMTRTIVENAQNASRTAEVSEESEAAATEGAAVVEQTIEKIRRIAEVISESAGMVNLLGESSEQIGEIVAVIDEIADQTNLLALNAAIEAARAGEHGQGFAVVADEVRELAERTTGATTEIASMIKSIQAETDEAVRAMNRGNEEVEEGIRLADRAGEALEGIVNGAQDTRNMIGQIAAASEEQSTTSEQISRSVEMISSVTAESAEGVSEIATSSNELSQLTEDLRALVEEFEVKEASSSTQGIDPALEPA